jgi:hypothetical protein
MNNDLSSWLFPAMLIVAVVEIILSSTWNAFYFRYGLPIFRRSYDTISGHYNVPSVEELEAALKSRFSHSVVFKQLDSHEYAFREKAFEFTWFHATPVMHGLLSWHPESGKVTIVGRVNWFIVAFTVIWFSMVRHIFDFIFIFFVLLVGLLYFIQAKRFEKVGKIACEKWLKAEQVTAAHSARGSSATPLAKS